MRRITEHFIVVQTCALADRNWIANERVRCRRGRFDIFGGLGRLSPISNAPRANLRRST